MPTSSRHRQSSLSTSHCKQREHGQAMRREQREAMAAARKRKVAGRRHEMGRARRRRRPAPGLSNLFLAVEPSALSSITPSPSCKAQLLSIRAYCRLIFTCKAHTLQILSLNVCYVRKIQSVLLTELHCQFAYIHTHTRSPGRFYLKS